jgi:acetyltransferase
VTHDAVFGPIITFGAGGTTVEIVGDRSVALPPLNRFLAKDLINGTHVAKMLGEFRGMPAVNMDALESVLLRVSEMVCELPMLMEMDINPLILDENGVLAADARIMVEVNTSAERYEHMAIYPYPTHLVSYWQLADGTSVTIRPIRPEDVWLVQDFVQNLSEEARYFRFMKSVEALSDNLLVRFTQIDYSREMALIAVRNEDDKEVELGVTRYAINPDGASCEFALVIADTMRGTGLGHKLMTTLMDIARARWLKRIEGEVLKNNSSMLKLMKRLGFTAKTSLDDSSIKKVTIDL